jgi:hypothetical protein
MRRSPINQRIMLYAAMVLVPVLLLALMLLFARKR